MGTDTRPDGRRTADTSSWEDDEGPSRTVMSYPWRRKISHREITLHRLRVKDSDSLHLIDQRGHDFDVEAFGRLKHGDLREIRRRAHELHDVLVRTAPELASASAAPFVLSAPTLVPKEATLLAAEVLDLLNRHRARAGLRPAQSLSSSLTYGPDHFDRPRKPYSSMSAGERDAHLRRYRAGICPAAPLQVRPVVIVDDISLTGTTTNALLHALGRLEAGRTFVTTVARLSREDAREHASIEYRMNEATFPEAGSIAAILDSEDWRPTSTALGRFTAFLRQSWTPER